MNAEAVITVAAAVTALVQFAKWSGVPDTKGPLVVLLFSLLGTAFWGYSRGDFMQTSAFSYFAGYIGVVTSAAGIFGFTRAARTAVTATSEPPPGAGK